MVCPRHRAPARNVIDDPDKESPGLTRPGLNTTGRENTTIDTDGGRGDREGGSGGGEVGKRWDGGERVEGKRGTGEGESGKRRRGGEEGWGREGRGEVGGGRE